MKKIAVVLIGWHYPSQPYENLINQKLPEGWTADFFVVGHRNPILSHNEKNLQGNSMLIHLDRILYKTPVTIEFLNNLGWTYIHGCSGNEWEGANLFLSKYDYKSYDCILFAGDDCYILSDSLFIDLLNEKSLLYSNNKIKNTWVAIKEEILYKDWLVISNTVHPGRQAIRGSFELFKTEIFDILGGNFLIDDQIKELSKKLNNGLNKSTSDTFTLLQPYNKQFIPFINIINEHNIYNKIKFLSDHYRASDYVIEAERGLLSNSNVYNNSYMKKITALSEKIKIQLEV